MHHIHMYFDVNFKIQVIHTCTHSDMILCYNSKNTVKIKTDNSIIVLNFAYLMH